MIEILAIDSDGVPISILWETDPVFADGAAAGLHVQFLCDVWVNGRQIFSHSKPFERLVPGVVE